MTDGWCRLNKLLHLSISDGMLNAVIPASEAESDVSDACSSTWLDLKQLNTMEDRGTAE